MQMDDNYEEEHYCPPTPSDPVYLRELECIEISRKATIAEDWSIRPTFAPKLTVVDKLFRRKRERYDQYNVPRVKSIYYLWDMYRPLPFPNDNNFSVLDSWIKILYLGDIDGSEIIQNLLNERDNFRGGKLKPGMFVTRKEKWIWVAEKLHEELPLYDQCNS